MKRKIIIAIIIIALAVIAYIGIKNNNTSVELLTKTNFEDIKTELLQVKAKVKVIKEQSVVKNDEAILKGEKLQDNEKEDIKVILNNLKEKELIKEDEEYFANYFLWNEALLKEMQLSIYNLGDDPNIVVNYETLEIIVINGFQLKKGGETLYKLSQIE